MDNMFPDWSKQNGSEFPVPSHRKPIRSDNDLVELLWLDGELIMQSQNNRKPCYDNANQDPSKQDQVIENPPNNLIPNDETILWTDFQIDECFDKEFSSSFMPQIQLPDPLGVQKISGQFEKGKVVKTDASNAGQDVPRTHQVQGFAQPPPRFESSDARIRSSGENFRIPTAERNSHSIHREAPRDQTIVTVGSSHCASNQVVTNDFDMSWASSGNICSRTFEEKCDLRGARPDHEVNERDTLEQAITSSSDGSRSSFYQTNDRSDNNTNKLKRKMKDVEESEQRSEATELDSAAGNKSSQKTGTTRKSRVAAVHNLSERRRRDRINDKMRALQELIPHSTKSDKASVLDEVIEYMKSLQLQLQLMCMGSGMAPVMLPGMQHYMARLGMGVGPQMHPAIQNIVHLSRLPLVDPALTVAPTMNQAHQMIQTQAQMFGPVNYHNQMQNSSFPEQYAANCMGFHSLQNSQQATDSPLVAQPMNTINFGSQLVQQNNHVSAPPGNGNGSVL